jgi:YHS domain-containing protein
MTHVAPRLLRALSSIALLSALMTPASAQNQAPPSVKSAARTDLAELNLAKGGIAIDGWDPVAYFPEGGGKPQKGKAEFQSVHRGVTYRFASKANLDRFRATPDRFEPAYGGWCAYAMVSGNKVEVDPESFLIQDGELLLYYNGLFSNTRKSWGKEGAEKLREKADKEWTRVHPTPERDLSTWSLVGGLALGGHDPVALLAGAKVTAGQERITWTYKGVTYRFVDAASRSLFRAEPWRFEPALGGCDAIDLAGGKRTAGLAEHAQVHDGRLYVFVSADHKAQFAKDPAAALQAIR